MKPHEIEAIDVHGHYGLYASSSCDTVNRMMTATAEEVVALARAARTCLTLVSPTQAISPSVDNDAVSANADAAARIPQVGGLRYWVVVDPRKPETYEQAADMLRHPACIGIKIHPTEHGYMIAEHGDRIFQFAAEHHAVVQTHTGQPECMPGEFVVWANRFPEMRLILAHLGFGWADGDVTRQVRAIQRCEHRNVFVDTSSSASLLTNIIEWAVGEIGADRIVYGTDTPCYFAPMMRARIDAAAISDEEKRCVLRTNALALFRSMGKALLAEPVTQ